MLYKIYDFLLESNVPLPGLIPAKDREGVVLKCSLQFETLSNPVSANWFRTIYDRGRGVYAKIAKFEGGYLLRFPDLVDFTVSNNGLEIDCYPFNGVYPAVFAHLLYNQVIPRVLSDYGEMVLHGSAVAHEEQAIVFLGEAGKGKSTISASFCQEGFPLVTDDNLLLKKDGGIYLGYPSYPGLRLLPDTQKALEWDTYDDSPLSHKRKEQILLDQDKNQFRPKPVLVCKIYILDFPKEEKKDEPIQISEIKPQQAFVELKKSSFDMDTDTWDNNRRTFERFTEAARSLEIFRLIYPREMSLLPQVRSAILDHFEKN